MASIKTNDIQIGTEAVIKGELGFCYYLTQLLDGEALQKAVDRDRQRGAKYPNTSPRAEAVLENVEIVCANPQAPNNAEKYIHERLFQNKEGKTCYRIESKKHLPMFGVRQADGTIKEVNLTGKSLATGQKVTCYYKCYASKAGNNGLGLDAVVFDEEPKLYQAEMPGGAWERLPRNDKPTAAAAPAPAQQATPVQNNPWGAPQPAPAPQDGFVPAQSSPWS